MTRTCRVLPPAVLLLAMGVGACQQPGQPGPMERTGAYIDRTVTDAQRGVADFSQRAGQGLDQAGRSVGAGAKQFGNDLHERLSPAADAPPPPPPPPPGSTLGSASSGTYPPGSPPAPTPVRP